MKLYIAGPMRGRREFNFPAFLRTDDRLQEFGHETFNPAANDLAKGFVPIGLTGNEDLSELGFDLRESLAEDVEYIAREADGIVVLPEWYRSAGARAEVSLALALGLGVYYSDGDDNLSPEDGDGLVEITHLAAGLMANALAEVHHA